MIEFLKIHWLLWGTWFGLVLLGFILGLLVGNANFYNNMECWC